jgi:hypothetical protein
MIKTLFFLAVIAIAAVNAAGQPPRFPTVGSYSWEMKFDKQTPNTYIGGRAWNDYDAGVVRWDTITTDDKGMKQLTEVTIFDLRNAQVTYITQDGKCYWENADATLLPEPEDFSAWSFQEFQMNGLAYTEVWRDGYGGNLYADAFTREVLSLTNTSKANGDDDSNMLFKWDWNKPSPNIFQIPKQLSCQEAPSALTREARDARNPFINYRALGLGCGACKFAVGKLIGLGCNAARVACVFTGPVAPFCGAILPIICKAGCTVAGCSQAACSLIRAC